MIKFACSLGDSTDGPIGAVLRTEAESRQEAIDYFLDQLTDLQDGINVIPGSDEVRVYFNPNMTEDQINKCIFIED